VSAIGSGHPCREVDLDRLAYELSKRADTCAVWNHLDERISQAAGEGVFELADLSRSA
jgi:hypothetical protein